MFPMKNNVYDFRGVPGLTKIAEPAFAKVIKPKVSLTSKLLSSTSLKSINGVIDGAQKVLRVYNEATPIIKQAKPMIDNVRTTFKVAKAFKRFGGGNSLEQAFDKLPDFEESKEKETIKETKEPKEVEQNTKKEEVLLMKKTKVDDSVPAPYYPVV